MEIILDETPKNYYLNLREFTSGAFEAVLKVVKPLKAEMMEASMNGTSYAAACQEKGESSRSGFTTVSKPQAEEEITDFDRKANFNRAVRRAKQNIRWLCKTMEADRLFTLTYRENVEDRGLVRRNFQEFLRLVRKTLPDWKYVAVLEKQERGAFHIHCAVRGFQKISVLRKCWYIALGGQGDESGEATPGAVNVTSPQKRWGSGGREWKTDKLAGYLTKYLSKTFDEESMGQRRFWHAKDVKAPAKQRIWIGGQNIVDAIKATVCTLELAVGLYPDFDMWLSSSEDCFWIAGRGGL